MPVQPITSSCKGTGSLHTVACSIHNVTLSHDSSQAKCEVRPGDLCGGVRACEWPAVTHVATCLVTYHHGQSVEEMGQLCEMAL